MNLSAAMTDESNADQQVARSPFRKTQRSGVRGADQRSKRSDAGIARIDGKPLTRGRGRGVEFADSDSSFGDNRHVVRLMRHDSRHSLKRYADCDSRWTNLRECARAAERGERDPIALAHPYNFANFLDAAGLDDYVRNVLLNVDWFANASRTDKRGD